MHVKDSTVETEFHPALTALLFALDRCYRAWGSELIISSGSEKATYHSLTSLHYAKPCQAADIRIWQIAQVPGPKLQLAELKLAAQVYCKTNGYPANWVDTILEGDHIHVEFQPKRLS